MGRGVRRDDEWIASTERALQLLVPGRRRLALALLLLALLLGAVAAVEAAGGGAEHAVMAGIMTGDAADCGAFQAALGVGGRSRNQRQCGDGKNGGCGFHDAGSPADDSAINAVWPPCSPPAHL